MLLLSAFFSSSETALFSLRQPQLHRLRASTARSSGIVLSLLEHPRRLLATILVGNTFVNVLMAVLSTAIFVHFFGPEHGAELATLVMTIVVLVFGEIAPKTLAVGRPLGLALRLAPPLAMVQRGLRPLTVGTVRFTDQLGTFMARYVRPREEALTEDEIKTLVTMSWEQGIVGAREKEFIHNVFHLDDRQVGEIVTPRTRVFAIDIDAELASVRPDVRRAGYSHVPLYSGSRENLVGYVEAVDLLWGSDTPDTRQLHDLRRELRFYPETKRVGELLADMRRRGEEIAGVVDEHGDYAGIVAVEDAVEQVVGEIFDLHDLDRFRITDLPGGELLLAAQMEITVFNQMLGTALRDAEAETIGGFVLNRLGRIPAAGDRLQAGGLEITIEQAAPNRIVTLRVRRLEASGAAS